MNESGTKGRLVALCGIDGSGKTTQAELLARRVGDAGHTVEVISFPRYEEGFFGDLIRQYLRGDFAGRAVDVDARLAALPYACDRWEALPRLRGWLAEGKAVICNRYVPANMAHQGAKIEEAAERRSFYGWIDRLEYEVFGLPRPDLQVLLRVSPAVAVSLLRARGADARICSEEDIHESDADYLQATARAYEEVARHTRGPWAVIPCAEGSEMLPPERIAEAVWECVGPVLDAHRPS